MKTAMQQFIDDLKDLEAVYTSNECMRELIGVQKARNLAEYIYFEKEKEQIMNAYDTGWSDGNEDKDLNDQYYFETYESKT